jgi:hypothetical protein
MKDFFINVGAIIVGFIIAKQLARYVIAPLGVVAIASGDPQSNGRVAK